MSRSRHRRSQTAVPSEPGTGPVSSSPPGDSAAPQPHTRCVTLVVVGNLVTTGPISVGGLSQGAEVDLPFATDGQGRHYIPGTALAGPMRAWMCARAGGKPHGQPEERRKRATDRTNQLWGFQPASSDSKSAAGRASRITVEDAVIGDCIDKIEIRDGVGIDRVTGAAAPTIKYNRAILPTGTRIPLRLQAHLPEDKNLPLHKALMGDLIGALTEGRLGFGAARSRGMGRVRLRLERMELREPFTRVGMLQILRGTSTPSITTEELRGELPSFEPTPLPRLTFKVTWQPVGPLMVKAERSGLWLDALPLTGAEGGFRGMLLPGSSLKGALRSMAERIVRTLSPRDEEQRPVTLSDSSEDRCARREFLRQLDVPLISWLFGAPASSQTADNEPRQKALSPGRSALTVDDCMASSLVASKHWESLEAIANAQELSSDLREMLRGNLQPAVHVAVDRWTGGASDGKLFNRLEPMAQKWNAIQMSLDLTRLPGDDRFAAIALLFLILRELSSGRLPLGFGTHRGLGAVKVDRIDVEGEDLTGHDWKKLKNVRLKEGRLSDLPLPLKTRLNREWKEWRERVLGGQS